MEKSNGQTSRLVEAKRLALVSRLLEGQSLRRICDELGMNRKHAYTVLKREDRLNHALEKAYRELDEKLPSLVRSSLEVLELELKATHNPARSMRAVTIIMTLLGKLSPKDPDTTVPANGFVFDHPADTFQPVKGNDNEY